MLINFAIFLRLQRITFSRPNYPIYFHAWWLKWRRRSLDHTVVLYFYIEASLLSKTIAFYARNRRPHTNVLPLISSKNSIERSVLTNRNFKKQSWKNLRGSAFKRFTQKSRSSRKPCSEIYLKPYKAFNNSNCTHTEPWNSILDTIVDCYHNMKVDRFLNEF